MSSEEDYRRHTRIREESPIFWHIDGTGQKGEAVIRDISVSGVLLEVSAISAPEKGSILVMTTAKDDDDLPIPEQARLVWSKAMKMEKGKYLCGLEFIQPSGSIVAQIAQRVESWFSRMAEAADVNILGNYFQGKTRR